MAGGLGFSQGDDAVLIIRGDQTVTRGDVRAVANEIEQDIHQLAARSAVTVTDDPARLLASIDMADRRGLDLYLAHTSLPQEHIDQLVVDAGVGARIDDAGVTATSQPSPSSGASGAIHLMTSGTSGSPKVAQHSLQTLLWRIAAGRTAKDSERWLLTFQPTGYAGLQVQLAAASSRGVIVVPQERTPAGFHAAAVAANVTHVSATPTFWRSLLMLIRPGELDLRQVTLGGEGADQSILDRLRQHFPSARVTHTYASTEAGVVFAVHDGRSGFPSAWLDNPVQGVELRLRDGFLHIRSAAVMRRYASGHAQPLLDDGWLATTDRCEIADDRVRILGRNDAMINVAGSKVYPAAVEAVLLALPQVQEARVYGVPNPIAGALVGTDIVLAAGVDQVSARAAIGAACREKLASYQQPRAIRFVDRIDITSSGKKVIQ